MVELKNLADMVEEMNSSNSLNAKKESLARWGSNKELLYRVYSPFIQFHVTSANLKKRKDLFEEMPENMTIVELLDELSTAKYLGNRAISRINGFIQNNKKYKELIYKIIDKNIETRLGVKTVNQVWKDFVPEFSVALAQKYEDYAEKISFEKDEWYMSRKLDGVRVIAVLDKGTVTFFSRNGKEFNTLKKVEQELVSIFPENSLIFDGEICIVDEEGNESYSGIMKEISKKNHTMSSPMYKIFDVLFPEEFYSKVSRATLKERQDRLNSLFITSGEATLKYSTVVEQILIENEEHMQNYMGEAIKNGWEGLIIRKNTVYKGKRSSDLLKVKQFHDAEYTVDDIEFDVIRRIVDGCDIAETMLSRIFITHKGNRVGVGSGFTMEQRLYYFENPEELLGKTVTIKYFEESEDKEGKLSLRFPVLKHIFKGERNV